MDLFITLYMTLLFFVLTPGVLFTLVKNFNRSAIIFTHAFVFALTYYFTHKYIYVYKKDGFKVVSSRIRRAAKSESKRSFAK